MISITYATPVQVSSTDTATVTLPSATTDDYYLLLVANDYGPGGVDNIAWPAGANDTFTEIEQVQGNTANCQAAAAYRLYTGTEPSTIDVTINNPSGTQTIVVPAVVSSADISQFLDQAPVSVLDAGNSTSHSIPGLTTNSNDAEVVYIICGDGEDTLPHTPTSFTEAGESGTGGSAGVGMSWGSFVKSTAGAVANESIGFGASDGAAGFMFAIKVAAAAGGLSIPVAAAHYRRLRKNRCF